MRPHSCNQRRPALPLNINGQTKLVGLIGYPVEHSLSPAMHNSAFAALDLNWCYVPLPVPPERLGEAVAGLRALGFVGANVTVPHKEAVMSYLDHVAPEAQAIGAVNTLVMREGRSIGHNTDWQGFLTALGEGGFDPQDKRAVVLGAGGAARAVVYALAQTVAQVTVLNRTLARAQALVQDFSPLFPSLPLRSLPLTLQTLEERAAEAHLLVNATPIGTWPEVDKSIWPEDLAFPGHLTVFDLVYNPRQTKLLRQARAVGAKVIGGLGMLVHQGAAAFELWTGEKAPVETMYEAASRTLVSANNVGSIRD
ncbi:MAG: shikimate dehydrogenase [Anaerolineae bacterium]|nr:shikimate dehydrogenase [Anaerolineae bacterium]